MVLPTVSIELIPDTEQGGFTAHISGIPAYGEGATEEEAIADLKLGIQLFVEENGLDVTLKCIKSPADVRRVNFGELVAHG